MCFLTTALTYPKQLHMPMLYTTLCKKVISEMSQMTQHSSYVQWTGMTEFWVIYQAF
jgi:hypothetical protein